MIYDCIVVGAGISGLSAAYALHRRGATVLVVESRDAVGGSIRSERTPDGFVLEHGPNTVVGKDSALWQHFAELGVEDQRLVADRRGARRFVLSNGRLELLPMAPPAFVKSRLLSLPAKLRIFAEPFIPRSPLPDESVLSFFTRRIGAEPAQRLVDPFVSGIYAGDPAETSVRAAFPALWEAEQSHGSIVLGMIASRKRVKTGPKRPKGERPRSVMFNFTAGLQTWPEAIAHALGPESVWLNTRVTALRPADDGWHLTLVRAGREEGVSAGQVILAAPAYVAAGLVEDLSAAAARVLRTIPYAPLAVVHLGYRREDVAHPLDGFGLLCPGREQRPILGMLWSSSLFPGRAPDGTVLLTTFVGGARNPAVLQHNDAQLIEMVKREQETLVGVRGAPVMTSVTRWSHSIPQYLAGHVQRLTALGQLEAACPGLHLLGNYREGVSVPNCWQSGQTLAARIAQMGELRQCSPAGALG